ncbi:hypothetical protein [Xylella fastidiosa]|uniref:hypothetical protein n=1 Tax=Xylella fastidiosa TaxID=2371 RepID=UPI0015CF15CD|nr:hypothetical protein [Xylella fastidiosa]
MRSGVRRVNNLPLIIGIVALCLFALLIAKVAIKRMNNKVAVAHSDTKKESKKNIDTSTMANEVLSGHGPGLIPDKHQLRMAKLQQFQEAIKANSKIALPYEGGGSGSTSMTSRGASATATSQSREEMLAHNAEGQPVAN